MEKNVVGNTALKIDEKVLMVTVPKNEVKNLSEKLKPVTEKKQEPKKEQVKAETVKAKEQQPVNIESLKEKMLRGADLSDKHDELKSKLSSFKQFQTNELANIVISDAKGHTMQTHQTRVIERFFDVCIDEYQNAINKIETELKNLNC